MFSRARDLGAIGGALVQARSKLAGALTLSSPAAMLQFVDGGLRDLVDVAASKMLETDDVAAQLAILVELSVERHGRDAIMAAVLRKNLLLDGTVLAFMEPVLTGGATFDTSRELLDRARGTLVDLVAELLRLDGDVPPEEADERTEWVAAHPTLAGYADVSEHLRGAVDDDALRDFVFGSYVVFLQSFLMRTSVRLIGRMLRGDTQLAITGASTE